MTADEIARYWRETYGDEIHDPSLSKVASRMALEQADLYLELWRATATLVEDMSVIEEVRERFLRWHNSIYRSQMRHPKLSFPRLKAGPLESAELEQLIGWFRELEISLDDFRRESREILSKLEAAWPIDVANTDSRAAVALGWVIDQVSAWIEERRPGHTRIPRDVLRCLQWYDHDLTSRTLTGQPMTSNDIGRVWRRYRELVRTRKN